jgi:hypothetical protein
VARFLSDEWVAAFNAALKHTRIGAETGSVRADSGAFSVEERVSGVPDRPQGEGPLRVVLVVADGDVRLTTGDSAPAERADVVISLSYDDAAALSRGDLDPTHALSTGRVHVRGDLAVLVAGQGILAAASERMETLRSDTTY